MVQSIQVRDSLEGPRFCQTQRGLVLLVTCFVLVLVFKPAQGISHRYADRNQQVLEWNPPPQKNGHCLLMLRIGYNGGSKLVAIYHVSLLAEQLSY